MSNIKTSLIEIYGNQYEAKATGRKFVRYTAKGKDGLWYNVRFAQKSGWNPTFTGWGEIIDCEYFKKDGKPYQKTDGTTAIGNPSIWIMAAEKVYPVDKAPNTDDELPF